MQPTPIDLTRAPFPHEYLAIASDIVDLDATREQRILLIAAALSDLSPRCIVDECGGVIALPIDPSDKVAAEGFDTEACRELHYTRIANDGALADRETADKDARQFGEVAA